MAYRKNKNQRIVRAQLRDLASTLNELSSKKGSNPDLDKLEEVISLVVSAPTVAEKKKQLVSTAYLFNDLGIKYPFPPIVTVGGLAERIIMIRGYLEKYSLDRSPAFSTGETLRIIAKFFDGDNYERIKRCPQCGNWFVDYSRNKGKQRCSKSCTNRWWSRGRRKQEGHGKGKKRRKRKEG
jgi:hypothetical protein